MAQYWLDQVRDATHMSWRITRTAVIATLATLRLSAQAPDFSVRDRYTKSEVMIPMRDGVKLFTIVYSPKDQSQRYPLLIDRTGYGIPPYGPDQYASGGVSDRELFSGTTGGAGGSAYGVATGLRRFNRRTRDSFAFG